ncbi:antitoxin VapB family protein [Salarchaeum sp. III]
MSKSIQLSEEAYERLAAHKREDETFSEVVLRLAGERSLLDIAGVLSDEEADAPEDGDGEGEMVKLNVKVPERLLDEIDELAEELNYTNRSEFIREVLRDTTEPILTLGAQEGVSQGYADVAAGRTTSHEEMKKKFGIDG